MVNVPMRTVIFLSLLCTTKLLLAAHLVTLTEETWDRFGPRGKEVDCIYGDFVLRNDRITAVVANPIAGRNANYRVRDVGGALIDLTVNDDQSDQLTAYYPGAAKVALRFDQAKSDVDTPLTTSSDERMNVVSLRGEVVELTCRSLPADDVPTLIVTYRLTDGEPFLVVTSTFSNGRNESVDVELVDRVCADRTFEYGADSATNLAWWYDKWFGQAYGIVAERRTIEQGPPERKVGSMVRYSKSDGTSVQLAPGEQYKLVRRIYPGKNLIDVRAVANQLAGTTNHQVIFDVKDRAGPVVAAEITLSKADDRYAWGRTLKDGTLPCRIPAGKYDVTVESAPRGSQTFQIVAEDGGTIPVRMQLPGYVEGRITDAGGGPIPCKIQFLGSEETPDPDFGPDSGEHAVKNLYYSANGSFRHEIAAGNYDVLVSRGPEYDAVLQRIKVERGITTLIEATLVRSVETPGWVSADFHGHSSPSGDNTASQYGRVLNLLCEHLEFAPCTEHNRLSSYTPHLKRLHAEHRLGTCVGIELTGSPGSVNHQNAFPMVRHPRTQDSGAPTAHHDPAAQIERLALWDDGSEKLVQENHPNIIQLLADRDLDGQADRGFAEMFGIMDVIEVHPPHKILSHPDPGGSNRIFNWLQMLNLGYRVPGVVNTDAHYNFHGSGFLRNYVKCPSDEPAKIKTMDIVRAAECGNLIMTNGPYLEVQLAADDVSVTAGDDIRVTDDEAILHVRVQCPNWFEVDRVQVFLNGQPSEQLNFRRRFSPDKFSTRTVRFEDKIPIRFEQDTHVIVVAVGEHSALGRVMGPDHEEDQPVAVSNPIFVDVDGDGFAPNGDELGVQVQQAR